MPPRTDPDIEVPPNMIPDIVLDVSRSLADPDATWPGDPPFEARTFSEYADHGYLSSALTMSAHCGTHMDLPAHVVPGGATIEAYPASRFVLPALVLDVPGDGGVVDEALVRRMLSGPDPLLPGQAVLWRTGPHGWLTPEAARVLADFGAQAGAGLVGLESASADEPGLPGLPAHHALLGAGVPILEGLDLSRAEPGRWLLVCPPLPAPGLEASPVRALLLRRTSPRL